MSASNSYTCWIGVDDSFVETAESCGVAEFLKRALDDLSRSADLDAAVIKASQVSCSAAPKPSGEAPQCGAETRVALGLALYRGGARSILRAAISAIQAMVDDSAQLPEAHKAVSSVHFQHGNIQFADGSEQSL